MARVRSPRNQPIQDNRYSVSTAPHGFLSLGNSLGAGLNFRDHPGRGIYSDLIIGDYPGYTNTPPSAYWNEGLIRANQIFPRASDGAVNWNNGRIGIADFSGSVGHLIWGAAQSLGGLGRYIYYARTSRPGYPLRAMVDSSLPEYNSYWNTWVPTRLADNGLTASQIGIATLSNGLAFGPSGAVAESQFYQDYRQYIQDSVNMQNMLINEIMTRFPNVRLIVAENMVPMHFSERLSVFEPYIFLRYWSLQRLIHDFINSGNYTTAVYWLGWGPDYYGFPGLTRQFDGLTWRRSDFNDNDTGPNGSDGVHPNTTKTPDLVNRVLNPRFRLSGSPMEIVCGDMIQWTAPVIASLISTTAATSYSVGPFNFPGSILVLVGVQNNVESGTPNIPVISGGGITWTQVNTRLEGLRRITVFRAAQTDPVTGMTLTVDFSGQSQSACRVIVNRVPYANWQSANQGVVQSVNNSIASGTSLTLTYATPESRRNGYIAFWHSTVVVSFDAESTAGPNAGILYSSWRGHPPINGTMSMTSSTAAIMLGIGMEIRRT